MQALPFACASSRMLLSFPLKYDISKRLSLTFLFQQSISYIYLCTCVLWYILILFDFFLIYNKGRTLIKPFLFSFCLITVGSIKTTTIITMISTNINSNKIMVLLLFPILVIVKSNVRQTRNELVTKKQIGLLSQRHVRVT